MELMRYANSSLYYFWWSVATLKRCPCALSILEGSSDWHGLCFGPSFCQGHFPQKKVKRLVVAKTREQLKLSPSGRDPSRALRRRAAGPFSRKQWDLSVLQRLQPLLANRISALPLAFFLLQNKARGEACPGPKRLLGAALLILICASWLHYLWLQRWLSKMTHFTLFSHQKIPLGVRSVRNMSFLSMLRRK